MKIKKFLRNSFIISVSIFILSCAVWLSSRTCPAPTRDGNIQMREILLFNNETINATATVASPWIDIRYSQFFGIGYKAASAGGTADIKIEYNYSYDGTNVYGTTTVTASQTNEIHNGLSLTPVVAPFVKFRVTGNAANPADTLATVIFAHQ